MNDTSSHAPDRPADAPEEHVPSDWGLLDAESQHEAFPDTFPIPTLPERVALRTGDMVKLVFVLDPPPASGPNAERMWVEVRANRPLGFATWETAGEIRNIAIRKLTPEEVASTNEEAG